MTSHPVNQTILPGFDPSEFAELLATEFKAINLDVGRKGVRLEREFWRLLSGVAADRGLKRSELIRLILAAGGGLEANAASLLRCYVAKVHADELATLRSRLEGHDVIRLLLRAPMPAFVIDQQKKLQEVNAEFAQLVRATAGNPNYPVSGDLMQLTLDVPVHDLFGRLHRATDETQCGYTMKMGVRQRTGRARVLRVVDGALPVLVGFILP
jgi:predicted DNA-binding ribbon-helix-helix protein